MLSKIFMNQSIELLDPVVLLQDLPEEGLVRGQAGTVVLVHEPGVFEVEFCDNQGRTYAMLPLKAEQLLLLHDRPVRASQS